MLFSFLSTYIQKEGIRKNKHHLAISIFYI